MGKRGRRRERVTDAPEVAHPPAMPEWRRRMIVIGFFCALGLVLATVALIFGWAQDPPPAVEDTTPTETATE